MMQLHESPRFITPNRYTPTIYTPIQDFPDRTEQGFAVPGITDVEEGSRAGSGGRGVGFVGGGGGNCGKRRGGKGFDEETGRESGIGIEGGTSCPVLER